MRVEPSLKLFFCGPGTGESIAIHLPDGEWGLIDCYLPSSGKGTAVLDFLADQKVEHLAFFCLTHPHADHFLGAEQVLNKYAGRIGQIWRWDGLTGRELQIKMIMAAEARSELTVDDDRDDREGKDFSKGFCTLIWALRAARRNGILCRRVAAPLMLLETNLYKIRAIHPDHNLVEDVEEKILEKAIQPHGFLLFDEDEGALLNSLSIVLQLEFGDAKVFLLGDAEGPRVALDHGATKFCVKAAHHGSENGFGAEGFSCPPRAHASVRCLVITPYARSGLPRTKMIERYRKVARELILTESPSTRQPEPTLRNARFANEAGAWHGVEILATGQVRRCN